MIKCKIKIEEIVQKSMNFILKQWNWVLRRFQKYIRVCFSFFWLFGLRKIARFNHNGEAGPKEKGKFKLFTSFCFCPASTCDAKLAFVFYDDWTRQILPPAFCGNLPVYVFPRHDPFSICRIWRGAEMEEKVSKL